MEVTHVACVVLVSHIAYGACFVHDVYLHDAVDVHGFEYVAFGTERARNVLPSVIRLRRVESEHRLA